MFRIFKSLRFWSLLLGFILTIILWHIQMWTSPENGSILPYPFNENPFFKILYEKFLWPNKIQIGVFSGITLFLSQVFVTIVPYSRKSKRYTKSIITHILNEKFKGDLEHTRITIFKVEKGIFLMLKYIWKCFIINFFKHKKKGLLINHLRLIPNPFKDYLIMYCRKSHPYESGTSTHFPIASNEKDVSGIASYVLFKGKSHKMDTDTISDIDITKYKTLDSITNKKIKGRLSRYMVATKLKDFDRLKCFHRLSNHIWANPIYDKSENQWGVIVVDNESSDKDIFDTIENELKSFTRIIELSVIHLN